MVTKSLGFTLLLAAAVSAVAQNAPPPSSANGRSDDIQITPNRGQSGQQLWTDRYECYNWAKAESGFDPVRRGNSSSDSASGRDPYRRALSACLEGRGYSVHFATPQPSLPPPAARPSSPPASQMAYHPAYRGPELKYHPFQFQIDGGYTITGATTDRLLDDGANLGLGFTWFPTSALPLGLRINGSYSWFDARRGLLDQGDFNRGHENIYGGDADIQLDLAHSSSRFKLYLFGGAGWYREQIRLRQVSLQRGTVCGFYSCGPGFGPVLTAQDNSTSPWRTAWNAGLGFETAVADNASFFVEARYLRIAPMSSKTQFVPITFGFRF
jgi:opacity protein-like surface antigen